MNNNYTQIEVVCHADDIEMISNIFYNYEIKGLAIEDPKDIMDRKEGPLTWDFADINILEYKGEKGSIKAYFDESYNANEILLEIKEKTQSLKDDGLISGEFEVFNKNIEEEDWSKNWKKHYKPIDFGKIIVKPEWEEIEDSDEKIIVSIDPGMAFGTGTHETTAMCINAIEKYVKKEDLLFDIGTGSGILAIAASYLGAKEVIAIDIDSVAVTAAKENIKLNKIENIEVIHGNLIENIDKNKNADIVVANILAEIIVVLVPDIVNKIKDKGLFIVSGIIKEREDIVLEALKNDFNIIYRENKGEWVMLVAEKK